MKWFSGHWLPDSGNSDPSGREQEEPINCPASCLTRVLGHSRGTRWVQQSPRGRKRAGVQGARCERSQAEHRVTEAQTPLRTHLLQPGTAQPKCVRTAAKSRISGNDPPSSHGVKESCSSSQSQWLVSLLQGIAQRVQKPQWGGKMRPGLNTTVVPPDKA